jgi:hypothetical protein
LHVFLLDTVYRGKFIPHWLILRWMSLCVVSVCARKIAWSKTTYPKNENCFLGIRSQYGMIENFQCISGRILGEINCRSCPRYYKGLIYAKNKSRISHGYCIVSNCDRKL